MANKIWKKITLLALLALYVLVLPLGTASAAIDTALAASDEWLLMVQSTSESSITLQWQPIENAWAYALYRSDTEDGEYERITTVYSRNDLIYVDEDCKENQGYYYRMSYFTFVDISFKESELSRPIYASAQKAAAATAIAPITIAPMAAGFNILPFEAEAFDGSPVIKDGVISSVTAKPGGSVEISWNAMTDAVRYHVCRSKSILGSYEVVGVTASTSFTDNNCQPNTTYYYSIGAELADGAISKDVPMPKGVTTTAAATPTPPPATATPKPTATQKPTTTPKPSVTAPPSIASPTPTPTSAPPSAQRPSQTNGLRPTATPRPSATAPAPAPGTQPGTGPTSKPAQAPTTQPTAAPSAPRSPGKPSVRVSENSVEVSWSQSKDAEGYNIYRSKDAAAFELAGSVEGKLKYTDNNLQSNAVYYYYVTAVKGGLESEPTETVSAPLGRAVELVLLPYSRAGTTGVELEWNRVDGAKMYNIYRSEDGVNFELLKATSSRSYDDKKAAVDTTIWYKVESDNGVTATASVQTSLQKLAVRARQAGENSRTAISLAWDAAAGARYYEIYRSANGTSYEYRGYTDADTRAWLDIPLQQDTRYYYKVVASNGAEGYVIQKTANFTLPLLATPIGTGEGRAITLKWSAVPGASKYTIYRGGLPGDYKQVEVTDGTSWTDNDLQPLAPYYYMVEADKGVSGRATSIALW